MFKKSFLLKETRIFASFRWFERFVSRSAETTWDWPQAAEGTQRGRWGKKTKKKTLVCGGSSFRILYNTSLLYSIAPCDRDWIIIIIMSLEALYHRTSWWRTMNDGFIEHHKRFCVWNRDSVWMWICLMMICRRIKCKLMTFLWDALESRLNSFPVTNAVLGFICTYNIALASVWFRS